MKCKTPNCETTMSEGAPEYCPKCQPQPTPEGKAFGDRVRAAMAAPCEACKGTGSIWHGDPPATFEAECHFCGGTGKKSEPLICWVCDGEMTRRQCKVICISCDMDYRRVKSELVVCDDLKNEWFKSSEFYEDQRDGYREALENIMEANQRLRRDPLTVGREMAALARDALVGRAVGAGVGKHAADEEPRKSLNAELRSDS